ncbi:ALYREF mRNA export adapter [Abortiporus biennis]
MSANGQRIKQYRSPKAQLVGHQPGHAAPAWKGNQSTIQGKKAKEQESKILLSRLPGDVTEDEVKVLFEKTVGPLKDLFLIYNSRGMSKGMAVVTFQRSADAGIARQKYHGKIIDSRRPIKIEIVKDEDITVSNAPPKVEVPSLLSRLGNITSTTVTKAIPSQPRKQVAPAQTPIPARSSNQSIASRLQPRRKLRTKKGPRRVRKRPLSAAQLDEEMEDYRARADDNVQIKQQL